MRKWKYWELFVTLFITANAIQMCFFRVGVSEEEQNVMDTLGIVFCCLYVAETVVNIIAMTTITFAPMGTICVEACFGPVD